MQFSPNFIDNVVRILAILISAFIIRTFFHSISKRVAQAISIGTTRGKRLKTLADLISASVTFLIWAIAAVMVLRELDFDITPILASAGVVGLAVGFGAQTLVKDVISGFFLLIENQFDEGDEVEISGKRGEVVKISLRTVTIRDKEGAYHIIPNGGVSMVTNFSKGK